MVTNLDIYKIFLTGAGMFIHIKLITDRALSQKNVGRKIPIAI